MLHWFSYGSFMTWLMYYIIFFVIAIDVHDIYLKSMKACKTNWYNWYTQIKTSWQICITLTGIFWSFLASYLHVNFSVKLMWKSQYGFLQYFSCKNNWKIFLPWISQFVYRNFLYQNKKIYFFIAQMIRFS